MTTNVWFTALAGGSHAVSVIPSRLFAVHLAASYSYNDTDVATNLLNKLLHDYDKRFHPGYYIEGKSFHLCNYPFA